MSEEQNNQVEEVREEQTEGEEASAPEPDGVVLKFTDEKEQQKWLDRQFSGRYKRKQDEIRAEERANLESELKERQAKEKGEYKELYETAEAKIGQQASRIQELETQTSDVTAKDERIANLEAQIQEFIKPDLERVPEHYRELVAGMSLDQQANWLTRNRENLQGPDEPVGSPATPPPPKRDRARELRETDKEVAEAQRHSIASKL